MLEFGLHQTPIDLPTSLPVTPGFKDKAFSFNYDTIDAKKQMIFNETGD